MVNCRVRYPRQVVLIGEDSGTGKASVLGSGESGRDCVWITAIGGDECSVVDMPGVNGRLVDPVQEVEKLVWVSRAGEVVEGSLFKPISPRFSR